MINIADYKNIHFVGIGGVSMSAIAISLYDKGYNVTGSDRNVSKNTKKVEESGIKVYIGHEASNLGDAEVVVFTGAVTDLNPEIVEAKKRNLPILRRTEALNIFLKDHKYNIAVSGTHGKTTTSCMITTILEEAGKVPDFFIGANVPYYKSAHRIQNSDFLVVEACEYKSSFLDFDPSTIVINNIDYDHVDYFNDIEHVKNTFISFANRLETGGFLVINNDDKYAKTLLDFDGFDGVETYSFGIENESYFMAKNIVCDNGLVSYDFYVDGKYITKIEMSIMGIYNVYNSLGAYSACYLNGIDVENSSRALINYNNASRRFELLKKEGEATLYTDYAHHPAEIIATLKTAKSQNRGELVVVFQPHTFSRTKRLLNDLIDSFDSADRIYIADIDPVREENIFNISSKDIVDGIIKKNKNAEYIGAVDNLESVVKQHFTGSNMVIAMGAGSIDSFARQI